jgi:hypothetical protein
MIGDSSMNWPLRDELHKALATCLGQPVEMPAQTISDERKSRRRAIVILWIVFLSMLAFALEPVKDLR